MKYKQGQRVVAYIDGELLGGTILDVVKDPDYPYRFIEFGKHLDVDDTDDVGWQLAESWETNDNEFVVGDIAALEETLTKRFRAILGNDL